MTHITYDSTSVKSDHISPRLTILIAGAGIGGLATAIGLRREGHDVHVFEQSSVVRASAYAIHLAPNGVGLLRKLGVDIEGMGSVPLNAIRFFKHDGYMFSSEDRKAASHKWQHQWFLGPRDRLHDQLLNLATTENGQGAPVKIHTDSKVVMANAKTGSFTICNGSIVHGDVIIGADGVFSKTREAIQHLEPYRSKHNCFRMMLDRKVLAAHYNAHVPPDETMDMIYSDSTKTVIYPTLNNTKFNCVVTHPTELTLEVNNNAKAKMMEICAGHDESFRNMLSTADDSGFRIWPLYDMDPPTTFVNDRLAILGDAAHPFTPHLAQGGVMALEDAASLSIMLHRGVQREQVSERLQLYNQARHSRSIFIQKLSLVVGGDRVAADQDKQQGALLNSLQKSMSMALSHDENHASAQLLREWLWKRAVQTWLQPKSFGPVSWPGRGDSTVTQSPLFNATVCFRTSATLLRNLLPQGLTFIEPDSTARMTIQLQPMSATGGFYRRPYYSIRFYIHGVTWDRKQADSQAKSDCLCLLSLENSPDTVTFSREVLGLPSRFSEIECSWEFDKLTTTISYQGICWAKFCISGVQTAAGLGSNASTRSTLGSEERLLVHKFIPSMKYSTETGTGADVDYFISYPPESSKHQDGTSNSRDIPSSESAASFYVDLSTSGRLPSLSNIISRLGELPLLEVIEATGGMWDSHQTWDWDHGYPVR